MLIVAEPTPSINRLLGRHWTKRRANKQQWWKLLLEASSKTRAIPACWPKAYIGITRYGAKLLDYDNFVAGCKSAVLDNLRQMGFFEDDSPDKLDAVYSQRAVGRDKRLHRTEIILESRE